MPQPERYGAHAGVQEKCDPIPMEIPAGCEAPDTLEQMFARLLHAERMRETDTEYETEEEANDFDMPESGFDLLDMTPYELAAVDPEEAEPPAPIEPTPDGLSAEVQPVVPEAPENSSDEPSTGGTASAPAPAE